MNFGPLPHVRCPLSGRGTRLRVLPLFVSLAILGTSAASAQSFTPGDVYVQTTGSGAIGALIQHVDLATGAVTDFVTIPSTTVRNRSLAYDRVRDRLSVLDNYGTLFEVDAVGNITTIDVEIPWGVYQPNRVTGTGDGRWFCFHAERRLAVVDECDGAHAVSAQYGDGPWFHSPEFGVSGGHIYYHPPTNEIFIGGTRNAGYSSSSSYFAKFGLDVPGLAVDGTSLETDVQVGPSFEAVVDIGPGPNGELFAAILGDVDDIYTLDPETLALSLYSQAGGGGDLNTAAYHPGLDQALTVHSILFSSELRAYSAGSTSTYTLLTDQLTGIPKDIVVIGSEVIPGPTTGTGSPDCNGNGTPDLCDIASGVEHDCDENGVPDSCDIAAGDLPDVDGSGVADACDAPDAYLDGWIYSINGNTNPTIYRTHPTLRDPEPWTSTSDLNASFYFFTYDPWRQALIFPREFGNRLVALPIGGIPYEIELPGFSLANSYELATAGDGRLYLAGSSGPVVRLSACNSLEPVLDETGEAPFQWFEGARQLFYHEPTSSLVIIHGGTFDPEVATRVPLDPEGRQVVGPLESVQLFPPSVDLDPVSISRGPGDTVMVFFDANGGSPQPQILTIDVASMTWEPYATFTYSTVKAGSYSSLEGAAFMNLEVSTYPDPIRRIEFGATDTGETWTTGFTAFRKLLVIGETLVCDPPAPPPLVDCNGNGVHDSCDIEVGTSADCNGNGQPDECDLAMGLDTDLNGNGVLDSCDPHFVRGDADGNGAIQVTDAIQLLGYLFQGATIPCAEAGDFDDDEQLVVADAVALLGYLFASGPAPTAPFPDCGIDPLGDPFFDCGPSSGCP